MKRISLFLALLLPSILCAQSVVSMKVDGTINPASAEFIHRAIAKAEDENAECLVLQLNTPGGLLKSTRVIVGDILESTVPVVIYVSPGGAHAGSAGVFIMLAAHIAAMAPGTNMGAAHPVNLQGPIDSVMNEKVTNDAAAFIRSIAEKRKRNWQWAEEAVRKSLSITEKEALEKNIIDLVVDNTQELLDQIDGKDVEVSSGKKTFHTRGARVTVFEMQTMEKVLDTLSDPNIAYILFLLGLYGIMFELYNPGAILPGIVGVICLILAFYAMHSLPINYAGLALIIFGIVLFLLEIKITSHGVLAIGGIISLTLGSFMLIRTDSNLEFVRISLSVIVSSVAITAFFFLFVLGLGLRAQRSKPVTGVEGLLGEIGESLEDLNPTGSIFIHGEIWRAESTAGKIEKGEKVRVEKIEDLKLRVEPVNT
jgi:membrane-bound serine protease (ClpP class)